MAKTTDFEIITEMSIIEPEGFMASLQSIGASIFDKTRNTGYYTETADGVSVRPKDQHFRTVTEDNIRYIHFDRTVAPYGAIGLEMAQFLLKMDADIRMPDAIGGRDIRREVSQHLHESIGECTVEGQTFSFDMIDDVPSERNQSNRLFVLRKMPEPETEQETTIRPLDVISSYVRKCIEEMSEKIYNIVEDGINHVEDGILIAYSNDNNPDKIQDFKNQVTKQLLRLGVEARAGQFEIRTQTKL